MRASFRPLFALFFRVHILICIVFVQAKLGAKTLDVKQLKSLLGAKTLADEPCVESRLRKPYQTKQGLKTLDAKQLKLLLKPTK